MSGDKGIIIAISKAISSCDDEETLKLVRDSINQKINPVEVIESGLTKGIREVGEKFSKGDLFLTDLMMAGAIMSEAVKMLEPNLDNLPKSSLGKIIIGTVQGDIHDIGKNIVAMMLQANGFNVYDLGVDVPISKFLEKINEIKPDIVGASALLTTTIEEQRNLVKAIEENDLRDKVKIMVGGAPVTEKWVNEIAADAFGKDAIDAVKKAKELLCIE